MDDDVFGPASGPKRTPQPSAMAERNREVLAERLGWPDGAVEATRQIERDFPGWVAWWSGRENKAKGFESPVGYSATYEHRAGGLVNRTTVYGVTPEELAARIREAEL